MIQLLSISMRYLQHTKSLRLFFPSTSDSTLVGETDADWSGDVNDRRSTKGYYFRLGDSGGSVSWQVKKQPTVSLSSCEAEYQGLAAAVQEAIFLRLENWGTNSLSPQPLERTTRVA